MVFALIGEVKQIILLFHLPQPRFQHGQLHVLVGLPTASIA